MIRRPPRSTLDRSSAASDVYKRQQKGRIVVVVDPQPEPGAQVLDLGAVEKTLPARDLVGNLRLAPVSYTHLRAHETVLDLVCRLLLEKKNKQ